MSATRRLSYETRQLNNQELSHFMLIFHFRCETQPLESGFQIIAPKVQKFIRIFGSKIRHGLKGEKSQSKIPLSEKNIKF